MKSSQNRSITKHLEKILLNRRNNKSTNKMYEKSKIYKDLNIIDSHSFLLKTFNKDKNYRNNMNNTEKNTNYKFNLNYFNVNKFKKNYLKNFCSNTSKNISNDKSDILSTNYNRFHKKNKTTNFCKIIEEIEKMKNEMNLRNDKRNKIICINSLNKNKSNNYKLKYTTPSKTLIKSVEIKNNKKNGNTNFKNNEKDIFIKEKLSINNHLSSFSLKLWYRLCHQRCLSRRKI